VALGYLALMLLGAGNIVDTRTKAVPARDILLSMGASEDLLMARELIKQIGVQI
jgi:hypothetical protein